MTPEPRTPSVEVVKWVYWGWTALGAGSVVFLFVAVHGWDNEGYYLTGEQVFLTLLTLIVLPAWIAGHAAIWGLSALARRLMDVHYESHHLSAR